MALLIGHVRKLSDARVRAIRSRRSVILGYHGIARSPVRHDLSRLQVRPSRFRAQIEMLVGAGFQFVTVAELARLANGSEPPPGYAAISFDDAMLSAYTEAFPLLREHGIRATVYVTVQLMGRSSPWIAPKSENRIMNTDQLLELAAAGWELGAHTMSHPDLSALDYEHCFEEIAGSKTALEELGGQPVQTLAYPFGSFGPASIRASRDSGLIAAVSTGGGSWSPFQMTRAMIERLDPMLVVLLKLEDRYEPLLDSPPLSTLRSGSKRVRGRVQRQFG